LALQEIANSPVFTMSMRRAVSPSVPLSGAGPWLCAKAGAAQHKDNSAARNTGRKSAVTTLSLNGEIRARRGCAACLV
jgi:hypothetical protein